MADDLIQIDEYIVTEQIIDFVLACVVARAQAPNSAHFVGGVMIDVHRWIFLPARVNPIDESLKRDLFFNPIVSPPIAEFELPERFVTGQGAKQIFQNY